MSVQHLLPPSNIDVTANLIMQLETPSSQFTNRSPIVPVVGKEAASFTRSLSGNFMTFNYRHINLKFIDLYMTFVQPTIHMKVVNYP